MTPHKLGGRLASIDTGLRCLHVASNLYEDLSRSVLIQYSRRSCSPHEKEEKVLRIMVASNRGNVGEHAMRGKLQAREVLQEDWDECNVDLTSSCIPCLAHREGCEKVIRFGCRRGNSRHGLCQCTSCDHEDHGER